MSRQSELKAARAKIQAALKGRTQLRVDRSALKDDLVSAMPTSTFFLAAGWYRDEPFHCAGCGKLEIWTAAQQKWWYEVAKGSVHTTATRCRTCRKLQREKRAEHLAKTRAGRKK